jgi:hypothetical protein
MTISSAVLCAGTLFQKRIRYVGVASWANPAEASVVPAVITNLSMNRELSIFGKEFSAGKKEKRRSADEYEAEGTGSGRG